MRRPRKPTPQTIAVVVALADNPSGWSHGYHLCRQLGLKAGTVYPILNGLPDPHAPGRARSGRNRVGDRATLGDDGLGSVTMLVPPVMPFSIGYLCARSTRSLRFGVETGILAALTTLVAVAVVCGVEAAHWYDIAPDVSVLDGDHVEFDSTRAAVLDAVHPIILLVHLVFWSPWPVLGAVAGARAPRAATG
jgi:hypothetical protein